LPTIVLIGHILSSDKLFTTNMFNSLEGYGYEYRLE